MNRTAVTPYGKTEIHSANPVNELSPGEHVLLVPGYGEEALHNKELVDALGSLGIEAGSFDQPRKQGSSDEPIQRLGDVVKSILDVHIPEGDKIHLVGHSLGAAAALKAAQLAPERFASVTLMQPAGMVGRQGLGELTKRVSKKIAKNQFGALRPQETGRQNGYGFVAAFDTESAPHYSKRVAHAQIRGGNLLLKQPMLALKEALAAGKYDITQDVRNVRRLGLPVNIVSSHSDEMFEQSKVDVGYKKIADEVSSYSSVADRKARHDTFWLQPRRTAGIIAQLIKQSRPK